MRHQGYTWLELIAVLSIITLVSAQALPSFVAYQQQQAVLSASRVIVTTLESARRHALFTGVEQIANLKTGQHWCLSFVWSCDCQTQNCATPGIETVSYQDFSQVSLVQSTFSSHGPPAFDGVRGLSMGHNGKLTLQAGNASLSVVVSALGRVRLCEESDTFASIEAC